MKILETKISAILHGTINKETPEGEKVTFTLRDLIPSEQVEEGNNKIIVGGKVLLLDTVKLGEEAEVETSAATTALAESNNASTNKVKAAKEKLEAAKAKSKAAMEAATEAENKAEELDTAHDIAIEEEVQAEKEYNEAVADSETAK